MHALLGGSSGQSEDGHTIEALFEHGQLAELGSEVVAPATDAVCLMRVSASCIYAGTHLIDHTGTQ